MASVRRRELGVLVAAWAVATVLIRFARELPWSLAAIAGLAAAVLVVVSLRTGRSLRAIWRDEDENR